MIKVIEYIDHKEWLRLRKRNAEQKWGHWSNEQQEEVGQQRTVRRISFFIQTAPVKIFAKDLSAQKSLTFQGRLSIWKRDPLRLLIIQTNSGSGSPPQKGEGWENKKEKLAHMLAQFLLWPHWALVATAGDNPRLCGTQGLWTAVWLIGHCTDR